MQLTALRIICETGQGDQHLVSLLPCLEDPDTCMDVASPDGKVLMCCDEEVGRAFQELFDLLVKLGAAPVEIDVTPGADDER